MHGPPGDREKALSLLDEPWQFPGSPVAGDDDRLGGERPAVRPGARHPGTIRL